MTPLETVKARLADGHHTCVLYKDGRIHTSDERGVRPLVRLVRGDDDWEGAVAADKVVGKGAAFLYVLLKVHALHAVVISIPALQVLESHGIAVTHNHAVPAIINRSGDGVCPFETAAADIDDAETAYDAVCRTMDALHITI